MAYDPLSLLTPRRLPVSAVDQYAQGLLGYQKTDPLSALSGMPDMADATLLQPTQRSPGFMSSLGGAFTGPGSSARLQALGAALLSGPSRTPISFGSQLAKGLLAGTQLVEEQKEAELKRSLLEAQTQSELNKAGKVFNVYDAKTGLLVSDGPKQVVEGTSPYNQALSDPDRIVLAAGTTASAGIPLTSELGVTPKALTDKRNELIEAASATGELVQIGNQLLEGYEKNPDAATALGTISGIGQKLYEDVSAIARAAGIDVTKSYKEGDVTYGFNEDHFDSIFKKYDIQSSIMKSQVLDLAYLAARARGQEGRGLSDRDVQIFSQIIGGTGSVESKKARLRSYLERSIDSFNLKQNLIIQQYPDIPRVSLGLTIYEAPTDSQGTPNDANGNDLVEFYMRQVDNDTDQVDND